MILEIRCYMQAIRLKPRSPVYWSCLAQSVYLQARCKAEDESLLTLAFKYLKVAISLRPKDYVLWNALGVVAAHPSRIQINIRLKDKSIVIFIV